MASPSLPPISTLHAADEETIKSVLDTLFEPAPEIHELAVPVIREKRRRIPANPGISADLAPPAGSFKPAMIPDEPVFTSYEALIRQVGELMKQLSSREKLHGILGSHPRLGAKKVDSAQSRAEQAQLNTGASDEAERLAALNQEYEERFPGLRYVVFVNGRSRDVIMEDMRRRIDRGDIRAEEREGIQAMIDIALDRAKKLA
ncbi:Oxo-4-hydroxy-4-carboxy-5-ureidoimidazoline decarboxylase [Poronia punctata]|nr:Oxo-4-hydroxy-4-carboxy-5-ureidoimidazoline decarboxylase [Poronia punctata]